MTGSRDSRLPYMPGIDALRAIAVLAVFFYHVGADWMPGGFLGVDVFFVISGYLITALLLSEFRRAGYVRVVAFWLRRARRLLPAVAVMIAVTLIVASMLIPEDIASLRGDALASLLYVNNWHLIVTDQSYFETFGRPSLFRHLWSLSVEEQFYLLWPLCIAAGMALLGRRRLLLGVLAGILLSTLLMVLLADPSGSGDRVFYGTDTRAFGLLIGAALAIVWHPLDLRKGARPAGWWLDAVGVAALVAIAHDLLSLHDFEPGLPRGRFLLLGVCTGLLVAALAHPDTALGRVLGRRSMVWLGLRSYGFYLWHWPLLMLTRPHLDVSLSGPRLVALQLAGTLVLADLSFRYVEQPFRERRDRTREPRSVELGRPALAVAVLATLVLVGWSGLVPSDSGGVQRVDASSRKIVTSRHPDAGPGVLYGVDFDRIVGTPVTTRGSAPGGPPVLAVGDSVMRGAADELARTLGGEVTVDTQEGRQAAEFPAILDYYRRLGRLPDRVIIQMGNNGPVHGEQLDRIEAALAGVRHVYLVNVAVPRSWQGEVNDELRARVRGWPEATLVDWNEAFREEQTFDAVHLNRSGEAAYSALIAQAVRGR